MSFKVFYAFILILSDFNQSFSFVQYEKFKRERLYYIANGRKIRYKSEVEDKKKKKSRIRLFLDDLIWMLEYNQQGLMSLFLFVLHISALIALSVQSIIYSNFPTDRDPETGEFVNEYLRYAEECLIIDFIYSVDPTGLLNRVLAFTMVQFLILRVRAFYIKFKRAKINRYGYNKINVVDVELCYTYAFFNCWRDFFRRFYEGATHECFIEESLSDKNRKITLEFNRKVKKLDKMDRIYFYNQISFDKCFYKLDLIDKYYDDIKPIDCKLYTEFIEQQQKSTATAFFEESKPKISWLQYIFSVDLPNRIGYVPTPEHRVDVLHGCLLLILFFAATGTVIAFITLGMIPCSFVIYKIFKDSNRGLLFLSLAALRAYLLLACLAFNCYDNGLLNYSSINAVSRSYHVVKLLKREIEFNRSHLRKFALIYKNYQFYSKIRSSYTDIPSIYSGPFNSQFSFFHRFHSSMYLSNLYRRSVISMGKFLSEDDEYYGLTLTYKNHLPKDEIRHFNENLDYLSDLVEVMMIELEDHKNFFTTYLDINLIFGVVESSVVLALLLNSHSLFNIAFALLTGIVGATCLIVSLILGATSELAVS